MLVEKVGRVPLIYIEIDMERLPNRTSDDQEGLDHDIRRAISRLPLERGSIKQEKLESPLLERK